MTSDAPPPLSAEEVHELADQFVAWAETLPARQRAALGDVMQRAAIAPLGNEPPSGPDNRILTDATYDRLFLRLQETAPQLTTPDA